MALATTADYEAITGTTLADASPERSRVESLLAMTESAVLAGAHGQNIAQAIYTAVRLNISDGVGFFPQRPVSNVSAVWLDGVLLTAGIGYRWTPGGNRRPALLVRVVGGCDSYWPAGSVLTATYTAGWDPVPGQVKALQVSMVRSLVANDGDQPATQEGAGPFQKSWEGVEVQNANLSLTSSAQATLDRLCGLRGPSSAPIGRDQV